MGGGETPKPIMTKARNIPMKETPWRKKFLPKTPVGEKINHAASPGVMAHVPAIRGLKEPFTTSDVERVCKVDKKKAANVITGLKVKEWVENAGYGEYKRTATFGGISLDDIHKEIAAAKKKDDE